MNFVRGIPYFTTDLAIEDDAGGPGTRARRPGSGTGHEWQVEPMAAHCVEHRVESRRVGRILVALNSRTYGTPPS